MLSTEKNIDELLKEIEELKIQLEEATHIIDSIRNGSIDALVLSKEGKHTVYSLESADYTYRVLIEKFSEGAVSLSDTGLILFCNDYFAKLAGTSPTKLVGTYFQSLVDSVGKFQSLKKNLINGFSKGEIILNIHGKKIPVYISLTDLNPLIPAIGIIISDLTEKRKHEEDLEVSQQRLESKVNELNETNAHLVHFIHVISHDIKEPLKRILNYSGRLAENHENLPQTEMKMINIINKSTQRLNSLVQDLTEYSLNTTKPELIEIDLNLLIEEVLEDMEITIKESNAIIKFEPLPKIMASAFQVKQLFLNLITNSIKFKKSDKDPTITITGETCDCVDPLDPNKKFHKISVNDNGMGISKAHLNEIFTIFQRLDDAKDQEGNGVGLAICKKIMTNHQGKIEAESPHKDGCIFNMYFPLRK